MSNISEYLYEIFAAILFCFGITFAISLYNSSTQQSEAVTQQSTVRENVTESEYGYNGDDIISGSTVIANIMADAGSTRTYIDGIEIPKDTIISCVENKDPALLMLSVDADAEYQISYTEDADSNEVQAVSYTKEAD